MEAGLFSNLINSAPLFQLTFKKQAIEEPVKKCYTPLTKNCDGRGPTECRTLYESSCTTRYIEKRPGKFVADTKCEKLPVEICGAGCTVDEGDEECHDKTITTLLDVPEEVCDLNPQKTCRFQTKLVPKLSPKHECTEVPQEICHMKFTTPRQVEKPLISKWCQDPNVIKSEESYGDPAEPPIASYSSNQPLIVDPNGPVQPRNP